MSDEKPQVKRVRCIVMSRVVGYYAPVDNWNVGKRQEWKDRRTYVIKREQPEPAGAQEGQ